MVIGMPILFKRPNGSCTAYGPRVMVQVTVPDQVEAAGATVTAGGVRYDFGPDDVPTADQVVTGTHAIAVQLQDADRDELVAVLRLIEGGDSAGALA